MDVPMGGGQRTRLPFLTGLKRRFLKRFRSRDLADSEWSISYSEEMQELCFHVFAERTLLALELTFRDGECAPIERVECGRGGDRSEVEYVVTERTKKRDRVLSIEPLEPSPVNEVVVGFAEKPGDIAVRSKIRVKRGSHPDVAILNAACGLGQRGELDAAIERLRAYEDYSTENPFACILFADCYRRKNELDRAQEYVAKGMLRGNRERLASLYRAIESTRPPTPIEDLRRLQNEARQWSLGAHHGVVTLDAVRRLSMYLNGWQLRKFRSVLEIRRASAGRLLTRLEFPLAPVHEILLHTGLRVVHCNDAVEEVPFEHFAVRDQDSRNPLVTTDQDRTGYWILPALAPGDLIEWSYAMLYRDRTIDGKPQAFALTDLFNEHFPTFHALVTYVVPARSPVRFALRNWEMVPVETVEGDRKVFAFEGWRFVPPQHTGIRFEKEYLNPIIATAADGIGWGAVARQAQRTSFGDGAMDEALPPPLLQLIQEGGAGAAALERAFYWIRDKLKYAAVRSGAEDAGRADRARKILESGVGDCVDKSYLLALVCRDLGLPSEFLLVSNARGIVVEETPANQFDHVFVRAEADGQWLYLDASNPSATFGSPPPWYQGLPALVLDEEGTVAMIPTDHPEANGLEILEVFDRCEEGRIFGRFEIRGRGFVGRLADEQWRAVSLWVEDPMQVGQTVLESLLPSSGITEVSRDSDTSNSGLFHVRGSHSRGPLVVLQRLRQAVLPLSWPAPFLPIDRWRSLRIDRLFAVELPVCVHVAVRFQGELRHAVKDVSQVAPTDNAICRVEAEVREEADALSIVRTVVFKKKLVRGAELEFVPKSLEEIERALRVVLSCDPALV